MDDTHYVEEIDLLKILEIIRKNILLFLAICILSCTAAFMVTKYLMKEKFTATSKLIIVQKADAVSNSQNYTYSDLQMSQKLANTYSQIMMSDAIADPVVNNMKSYGFDMNAAKYKDYVVVSSANNTEVMNVTVTTNDPELSARLANEVAAVFESKIYDIMQIENVTTLSQAKVPTKKSGPSTLRNVAVGGIIGVLLCGIYAAISLLTDTKVKTEEEVKKIFDYPIIGNIPDFEVINKEVEEDE